MIDFSEFVIGNTIREMRHFYSLSPEFMELVAKEYCTFAGVKDVKHFIAQAYAFRAYRDFTNLVKSTKFPNNSSIEDKKSDLFLRELMNIM